MMPSSGVCPPKVIRKRQRRGVRREETEIVKRGGETGVHVEEVGTVMTEGTAKTEATQAEKAV